MLGLLADCISQKSQRPALSHMTSANLRRRMLLRGAGDTKSDAPRRCGRGSRGSEWVWIPRRPVVTLEVLFTSLQSSGGKCDFLILGAVPASGFHRPGRPRTTSSPLELGRGCFLLQLLHVQEFGSEIWARETQNLVPRTGLGLKKRLCIFFCA